MSARQMADDTPNTCAECGVVEGDVYLVHGRFLCSEHAQEAREEQERDYALMDVYQAMRMLHGSRTWA